MQKPAKGKVYLLGAGPGDPELLTLKAARILKGADVVLYDRLVDPQVLEYINPAAEVLYVGKEHGEQHAVQQKILDLLLNYATEGRTVVRLKGGDPLVFGRGAEEWHFLREHKIEVEYVPGVSSATSGPGIAGIPLTYRGISQGFAVITGSCCAGRNQDWSRYAKVDTLVILMGSRLRQWIANELIAAGRDPLEPVAFVERCTMQNERTLEATLKDVAEGSVIVESPAVLVIGEVVLLRRQLLPVAQDEIRECSYA